MAVFEPMELEFVMDKDVRSAIVRERRRWWLARLPLRAARDLAMVVLVVLAVAGGLVMAVLVHHPLAREAFVEAARADVAGITGAR